MDLNLDTLKREILEYLEGSGFAVFRSRPNGLEGLPMVLWDAERFPDYQLFLDVARKAGTKLILFAASEFTTADLDELVEQLDDMDLTRDERREYESRVRDLRVYEGLTCSLEIGFDFNSRLYVYQLQPDWYDDFLNLDEEISARYAGDDEMEGGDSLGGYFSKN